tara:strand:+ start:288 stop:1046 length:759 start_codon:yes stop_codon:yes gene_type:complete
MGIINLTPDSFYDGDNKLDSIKINNKINQVKNAHIVDIGAESTRPGSRPITVSDEINRLKQLDVKLLKNKYISIDSYKYNVIKYALDNGFNMINDITGGGINNSNIDLAIEYNVPIIIMHMKGNPENMQLNTKYNNLIDNIMSFFDDKINYALKEGLNEKNIILDPGLGFGKSVLHNYQIIENINKLKTKGYPILLGISRKSFLDDNDKPSDRLYSSLAVLAIAAFNGADIFRVHDVKESFKILNIMNRFKV